MTEVLSKADSILERPFMEFRPFGVDTQGQEISDITGLIIQSNVDYLYDYVSNRSGVPAAQETIDELCRLLNERIRDSTYHVTPEILRNAWNSYSYEFGCYLRELCELLSGDDNFHFNAGRARKVPPIIQILLRPFSVPEMYKLWDYVGSKYTKGVVEYGVGKVTDRSAVLWIKFTDQAFRQFGPYSARCIDVICQSSKGAISGAQVHIHGMAPASIRDLRCAARGDDRCEWEFTWTPKLQVELSWLWWFVPSIATLGCVYTWQPEMPFSWMLGLAFVPTLCVWLAMTRLFHRQTRQLQSLIRDQEHVVDLRHEELRGAILEQQRIAVELRHKITQLKTLHRASLVCNSVSDRELLIKQALETIVKDLHYERVRIAFFDEQNQKYTGIRILGGPAEIARLASSIQTTITDPETIEGTVLLKGQSVLIDDMVDVMDRLHPLNESIVRQLGTRSLVSVPMKVEDRILGSISVDRSQPHMLTQEDVEVLSTFGNHFAIALKNLAAYGEIETLNAELEEKVRVRTAQLESANERLKELDQLKSTFVSVVSHEVRSPMTSIRMQVENMLDGLIGSLNDKQSHSLSRILFSVDRLTRLSGDLLDLSKIESGTVELRREPLRLKSVVDEIVDAFRYLFAEKSVALEVSHADEAVTIFADRDKLVQIFINLLGNALKFTGSGGTIQILTGVQSDGFVSIRVTDTGCGIGPDEISRVFEKFYRGEAVPSGARGAGLGLAIVKNLVELHGGTVGVESAVNKGSSIFFTLPMSRAPIPIPLD